MGKAKIRATSKTKATTDPRRAYEQYLPQAMALQAASVPATRASPSLARANADVAVRALDAYRAKLVSMAPWVDHERIRALPALVRAYEYCATLVAVTRSDGSIKEAVRRIAPLRLATLSYLDAAAFAGLVDGARVRKIRTGRGTLDLARDAVAIAGLFHELQRALEGKHPFTAEQLAELGNTGAWLVERLKPSGAPRDPRARSREAQVKDRFAKLVEQAYAELEKAGAQIWGVDGLREHIPPLYSFTRRKRKTAPPPAGKVA